VQNILEQSDSPYEIIQARKAIEAGVSTRQSSWRRMPISKISGRAWHRKEGKGLEAIMTLIPNRGKISIFPLHGRQKTT
jgi:hypothetical protein